MGLFRKRIKFETVAKFNMALDKNVKLRNQLENLSLHSDDKTKEEYLKELLNLFKKEGIDITVEELDKLLLLRQKTNQMLLEKNQNDKDNLGDK